MNVCFKSHKDSLQAVFLILLPGRSHMRNHETIAVKQGNLDLQGVVAVLWLQTAPKYDDECDYSL